MVGCCVRGLCGPLGPGQHQPDAHFWRPWVDERGVPALGGGPGHAGCPDPELVQGHVLLSPHLFSVAPLQPS